MAKNTNNIYNKAGNVEYKMPRQFAKELLNSRKGAEANMDPQDFLVKYVNEQCGLLHYCSRVLMF